MLLKSVNAQERVPQQDFSQSFSPPSPLLSLLYKFTKLNEMRIDYDDSSNLLCTSILLCVFYAEHRDNCERDLMKKRVCTFRTSKVSQTTHNKKKREEDPNLLQRRFTLMLFKYFQRLSLNQLIESVSGEYHKQIVVDFYK